MKTVLSKIIFIALLTIQMGIISANPNTVKKLYTMEIYNSDGSILLMQRTSNENDFSIASLQPGEYKMLIFDENNTVIFYETIVKPACMATSSF